MTQSRPRSREFRPLLRIAAPLALYYLTEVAMGLTDMVIVVRLGSDELAAVGLAAGLTITGILLSTRLYLLLRGRARANGPRGPVPER